MPSGVGIMRACVSAISNDTDVSRNTERTHIMYAVLVWILSSRLIFKQGKEQLLADNRVGVKEQGPRRVDHVHCVDVLHRS